MESLLRGLRSQGVPAPVSGYELGDDGWQAELAWPDTASRSLSPRSPGPPPTSRPDRDAAYAAAGWHARPVKAWNIEELAALVAEGEQ